MSLSARTYSAVRWTTAAAVVRAILRLLQLSVLTRLLAPGDFGLMAMVTVVISYAALFSDMGLSSALVQRQQISHEERSSLYWLSVAFGGLLTLLVMAASPLAAYFFKEPLLSPLMVLVATNFLVSALGQQLRVFAEKALNFKSIALIEISAALVGFTVAVLTAISGWGVFALVAAAMTSAWFTTLFSWVVLAQGWRPTFRLRWEEVSWFVKFGGTMVLNGMVNQVNATIDLVLGGRVLGATQLGYYSVPRSLTFQIQGMVNPIFTRVGFPLISSIQHDTKQVKQVYLKTMKLTASINAPIYCAMFIFAPEVVFLLFGNEWIDAVPILRALAVWGFLRSIGNPVGSLVFGLGRAKLMLGWNLMLLVLVPPLVWLASSYGAQPMAWAMSSIMFLLIVPNWAVLVRPICGAGFIEYIMQIVIPTLCAVAAGAIAWVIAYWFQSELARLIVGAFSGLVSYLVISVIFNKDLSLLLKRFYSTSRK